MKHGANIYKYAKKLKCKPNDIIDFSSNINLYNPKIDLDITTDMVLNTQMHHIKLSKKPSQKNTKLKTLR